MAVFSTNQNRHLYVANAFSDSVSDASAVGTIGVKAVGNGNEKEFFFIYKGADTVLKSDRIPLKNLSYAKAISAEAMRVPLKKVEITLDSTVNSGAIVGGQDYILRINFRQFYGLGERHEYVKDAAVHGYTGMSASDFYKKMVESLNASFSRELGATKTSNPYLKFEVDNTTTATKIIITEKPQEWSLGIEEQERVYFDVFPTQIFVNNDEPIWGVVADTTPTTMVIDNDSSSDTYNELIPNENLVVTGSGQNAIGNGNKIADLEWFCMGERGDQYRMVGYPNYIPTKYLVNPAQEYNVLELHFAFTDEGVNSYRSEKDITVVATSTSVLNSLIGAINSSDIAGTSIETL